MIYFGVPTFEAVLMRSLGVPRPISVALGKRFTVEETGAAPAPRLQKARAWLEQSSDTTWQEAAYESNLSMDGKRMRDAWRIITGNQPWLVSV
jgi:hypothetical protein